MKLFLLIAFLNGNAYVLDSHMSGEDCTSAIEQGISRIEVSQGVTVPADGATFACQLESK